ncbi:MAG: hypothetical protein QM741_11895 [Rudaea sp.]|uniref:hypothetical protein n=1 Tax=Rudaea sp. TaxID=2136325 RepID=UPI0039E6086A
MSAAQRSGRLPRLFERVRLVTIQPPGYAHSGAFAELVDGFRAAFAALGAQVDAAVNQPLAGEGVNFVFGAHLIAPEYPLPQGSIIVNLEQMRRGMHVQPHYVELLKRHAVLDYSARNVARIIELTGNRHVHPCRIGYMPELTRIEAAPVQDIDVLFYGVLNERRKNILDGLAAAGIKVAVLPPGVYGAQRDAAIARAKIVLNVHFYEDKVHEIVRSSYLLANRKIVVSECETDTEIDDDIREAVIAVPYAGIVETCVALLRDEARRAAIERKGYEIFARRDQAALLAEVLPKFSLPFPRHLNLGSGKAYDAAKLNIDIDPKWKPDVLGNLVVPGGLKQVFFSRRFGLVRLEPGRFDDISTIDVLEHVPDLVALMTRCLELLDVGGTMRIVVPYDLSWGAWQDPTHVRAFNERSWLYYTDWHWYLGWNEARFDVKEMGMKLSAVGEALRQRGTAGDELFRVPRAVDEMQVVLVKRLLSEAERQQALAYQAGRRDAD